METTPDFAGIIHDLNNIFLHISLSTEILQTDKTLSSDQRKYLNHISEGITQSKELMKLLVNNDDDQKASPDASIVDVEGLLRSSAEFIFHNYQVVPEFVIEYPLMIINGRKRDLSRVFCNLYSNAADAMAGCGSVRVFAENLQLEEKNRHQLPAGDYVRVIIEDEGCGIPSYDAENVFQPFFSNKPEGSGLGLTNCRNIIDQHGGCINVSDCGGQCHGAAFEILLPAVEYRNS